METKNQWDTLRWSLEELSSENLQENLWLGKIKGQISSFDEAVNELFDGSGLGKMLYTGKRIETLPEEFYVKAKYLECIIDKVPRNLDVEFLIKSREMSRVRKISSEMLDMLQLQ
jgi:hypothetical protein